MSVRKFKFVSPGVFVNEIDNSQLPAVDTPAGPIIFGRLPQGPGMRPVKVDSFSDFVQVFGNPIPGKATGDVWRDGNHQGTTYASYAAQAYLRADVGSITVMRLLGEANPDADNPSGYAGWQTIESPVNPRGMKTVERMDYFYVLLVRRPIKMDIWLQFGIWILAPLLSSTGSQPVAATAVNRRRRRTFCSKFRRSHLNTSQRL